MNLKAKTSIYKLLLISIVFFLSSQICVAADICFYCQHEKKDTPPYCQCKAHERSHRESITRIVEEIKTEVINKQEPQNPLYCKHPEELNTFTGEPSPLTKTQEETLTFLIQVIEQGACDTNTLLQSQQPPEHKTYQVVLIYDVRAIFELFIQRLPQNYSQKCDQHLMRASLLTAHSLATAIYPEQFPFTDNFDDYLRVLFCVLLKGVDGSGLDSFNSQFLEIIYKTVLRKLGNHDLFEQLINTDENDIQKVVRCNKLNVMFESNITRFHKKQCPHRKCLYLLASAAGQPDISLKYVTLTKASPTKEQVKFYTHTLDLYSFEFDDASQFQTVTENYLSMVKERNEAREAEQKLKAMKLDTTLDYQACNTSIQSIKPYSRHLNQVATE